MAKTIDQTILQKAELLVLQLSEIAESLHKARVIIKITCDKLEGPVPDYPGLASPFTGDLVTMVNRAHVTNAVFNALLLQLIDERNLT